METTFWNYLKALWQLQKFIEAKDNLNELEERTYSSFWIYTWVGLENEGLFWIPGKYYYQRGLEMLQEAFQKDWFRMGGTMDGNDKSRNQSTHTYNESTAHDIEIEY
jgi:hypothetical protein